MKINLAATNGLKDDENRQNQLELWTPIYPPPFGMKKWVSTHSYIPHISIIGSESGVRIFHNLNSFSRIQNH